MSFNKKEYWERRNHSTELKDGKGNILQIARTPMRGQDSLPEPKVLKTTDVSSFHLNGKFIANNRANRRKKAVSHLLQNNGLNIK